jgi:hypothetical protein
MSKFSPNILSVISVFEPRQASPLCILPTAVTFSRRSFAVSRHFPVSSHHRWPHRPLQRGLLDRHAMDGRVGLRQPRDGGGRQQHISCSACGSAGLRARREHGVDEVSCGRPAVGTVHAVLRGALQWCNPTSHISRFRLELYVWISWRQSGCCIPWIP